MKQPDINDLKAFKEWFLSPSGPGLLRIPVHHPIGRKAGLVAITLYRRNGYKAEFCHISPEKRYGFDIPEEGLVGVVFLGGSIGYGKFFLSIRAGNTGRITSPDEKEVEIAQLYERPDYMELPHPILLEDTQPVFYPLSGGRCRGLRSGGEGGVLLFFSFDDARADGSVLEYFRVLPDEEG